MSKIQYTEDYSSFTRINGNRTINKAQVKRLYDSFNEHPELASAVPIVVNDKMEILDGQHRFQALKKLNLPICYIQVDGLDLKSIQIINSSTKNWTPTDYAKSWSELGNENYKTYLEFKTKYGFAHAILILFLTGMATRHNMAGRSTAMNFRQGKFEVVDIDVAHDLAKKYMDFQKFYNRGDSRVFALAFKRCALNPIYDHARMIEKLTACGAKFLQDSPYAEDYMRQLEKIYNYHNGEENRVKLF